MKQTSVEWLFEKLWETPKDKFAWYSILEQAKQIEKEQMKQALLNQVTKLQKQFEEYYNEYYGK